MYIVPVPSAPFSPGSPLVGFAVAPRSLQKVVQETVPPK